MATPSRELVHALRLTAQRLENGAPYRWSSYAACNCGHLAQTVTRMEPAELQRRLYERGGDWAEQARELCPSTGLPNDVVFRRMVELGLDARDFRHLERLESPEVLERLPAETRPLRHYDRRHVVAYLRAWADLLEERLRAREARFGADARKRRPEETASPASELVAGVA